MEKEITRISGDLLLKGAALLMLHLDGTDSIDLERLTIEFNPNTEEVVLYEDEARKASIDY
jgi:hypothetical protein